MSRAEHADVVIVGGGLAGLAAAAFSARAGCRVVVLERAERPGGRAVTQDRDGFRFNIGPHALYRQAEGMAVLRDLGIKPRGGVPGTAGGIAVRDGRRHALPGGFLSLLTTSLLSLAGKLELAKLLGSLQQVDSKPLQGETVEAGLACLARRTEVRDLLAGLIRLTTYANAPTLQSAGAAIDQLKLGLSSGVLYLDGGWQTLVDALRDAVLAQGVEIVSRTRATAVESSANGALVRAGDGTCFPAGAVILAMAPGEVRELLPGSAAFADSLGALTPIRAACLDVALSRLPDARSTFALGVDRPLYLSVHSAVARLAPPGGALIHVAKYLDPTADETPDAVERELTGLLDLIQPGWTKALVHRRYLPHVTVSHAVATAAMGGCAGRPGPIVPSHPRVLLAGDWVGPSGMLADASLGSGRTAGNLAAQISRAPGIAVAAA